MRLLTLTNPAAPVALGTWNTFLPLSDAVLAGNLAYVGSWEVDFLSTIEIVEFTDPARPVLRGYYDTPGYVQDLVVRNNIAYVADAGGGFMTLDVGNPAWPRWLGGYDTRGSVQHVEVSGRYAYVSDGNWLVTLDVSDPTIPRRVGLYEVAGGISSLKALGTKLYLAEGSGDVRILSMTNPANAQLLGTYRGWGNPAQGMAVSGSFLYLAKEIGGLHVLDVGGPGGIGFLHDYLKLKQKREGKENVGLVERYKLAGQVGIGLIVGFLLWKFPLSPLPGASLTLPFFKYLLIVPASAGLAWLYVPWVTFILTGTSNSVNLTDGLDGLAAGLSAIALTTFALFPYLMGRVDASEYLQLFYLPGSGELTVFCMALVGA